MDCQTDKEVAIGDGYMRVSCKPARATIGTRCCCIPASHRSARDSPMTLNDDRLSTTSRLAGAFQRLDRLLVHRVHGRRSVLQARFNVHV